MLQFWQGWVLKRGNSFSPHVAVCELDSSSWNMHSWVSEEVISWAVFNGKKKKVGRTRRTRWWTVGQGLDLLLLEMLQKWLLWVYFNLKLCLTFGELLINWKKDYLSSVPILLHFCAALEYENCGGLCCVIMTKLFLEVKEINSSCKVTTPDGQLLSSPLQHNFRIVK